MDDNVVKFDPSKTGDDPEYVALCEGLGLNVPNQFTEEELKKITLPDGFKLSPNGLYFADTISDKDAKDLYICSPIIITGKTKNEIGTSWGRIAEFLDADNTLHTLTIPMELFASDGSEFRRILLDAGLAMSTSSKCRNLLNQYVQAAKVENTVQCVNKIGWYKDSFVLPLQVIGINKKIVIQGNTADLTGYHKSGDLDDWKTSLAGLCVGNTRLMFAVSLAFAPVLLYPLNAENCGFHLRGRSSTGKTSALLVAASVWGHPHKLKRTWRATSNGLEGIAEAHNDLFLPLDELGEMSSQEAGAVAYMLANGQGKGRANRNGDARMAKMWRTMFLSTGELTLAQHIESGGGRAKAGQEVRILDIAADVGKGFGLFENLHGHDGGEMLSLALCENANKYYGSAGPDFLVGYLADKDTAIRLINLSRSKFIKGLEINEADGQVKRAAKQFALVAAAGELATYYKITGWQKGEAELAAEACFYSWLDNRGGKGSQETAEAIKTVKLFIEKHGDSRFTDTNNPYIVTNNRAGFVERENEASLYYFFAETFRKDVCQGLDHRLVLKALNDSGFLIHDNGRLTKKKRIPIKGEKSDSDAFKRTEPVNTYCIKSAILK